MAWTTPKTNWVATDFINYTDYERVRNNILYLRDLASTVYAEITLENMTAKSGFSAYPYASEFNTLERNLHHIFNSINTIPSIGTMMTFYDNGATPNYAEWNRIESACLSMYNTLNGQISGRLMLSFTLNGGTIQT